VLAAAHLDSDPTNNRMENLRALCQRCHMKGFVHRGLGDGFRTARVERDVVPLIR
jgi:hypothetical protein